MSLFFIGGRPCYDKSIWSVKEKKNVYQSGNVINQKNIHLWFCSLIFISCRLNYNHCNYRKNKIKEICANRKKNKRKIKTWRNWLMKVFVIFFVCFGKQYPQNWWMVFLLVIYDYTLFGIVLRLFLQILENISSQENVTFSRRLSQ